MELEKVLSADAAHQAVVKNAEQAAIDSFDFVVTAIRERESAQQLTKHKLVKIGNAERIAAIKQSRVPRTDKAFEEILKRTTGGTTSPKGNVVVLVVGLGEESYAKDFYKYVSEFADDTDVLGADMYGFNANADTTPNDFTDQKFESLINEVAIMETMQASVTCDVLAKRQPFSDIFSNALRSIANGN